MWIILLGEKMCKKKLWMSQMLELSDKHFKEDVYAYAQWYKRKYACNEWKQ